MAIFSRKDTTIEDEAERVSREAISCIISKEMHITGEITFKGKARIDGTVDGNITGEYLVLSETGLINGNLALGALICHGTVKGDIDARLVTAHSTASIKGKLTSANLTVEPGACLEGEIHSTGPKKASQANEKPDILRKDEPASKNRETPVREQKKHPG